MLSKNSRYQAQNERTNYPGILCRVFAVLCTADHGCSWLKVSILSNKNQPFLLCFRTDFKGEMYETQQKSLHTD